MKLDECQDILSIRELCLVLRISKPTAYKFIKEHNIEYLRIGQVYKISKASVAAYLNEQRK